MDQDVCTPRKLYEVLRWTCIARNHDSSVWTVKTVCKRRFDRWMIYKRGGHSNIFILQHQTARAELMGKDQTFQRWAPFVEHSDANVIGVQFQEQLCHIFEWRRPVSIHALVQIGRPGQQK